MALHQQAEQAPCLRCATAVNPNSSASRGPPEAVRLPLCRLPAAAVALLAELLDIAMLSVVAQCCVKLESPLYAAFQRRARLWIPPDAQRSSVLVDLINEAPKSRRLVGSNFAVTDSCQVHVLHPIRGHVKGLVLDPRRYARWGEMPFQCVLLTRFPELVRLEISCAREHPIDLTTLVQAAPQLQCLTIKNAYHLTGTLHGMLELQSLSLDSTNIDSFTIAFGLPKLTSLALSVRPITFDGLDAKSLKAVSPLTHLVLRGHWAKSPHAGLRKHLATLRTFSIIAPTHYGPFDRYEKWRVQTQSMTQLHTLRLDSHAYLDLRPLLPLRQLLHLQIVMSSKAKHCRPLRELTSQRELQVSQAWVCDIIGFLPQLHTLVCEDGRLTNSARARLGRRLDSRHLDRGDQDVVDSSVPQLRKLVLRGNFTVDVQDPVVQTMLHRVVQLEVWESYSLDELLPTICRLPHLRRLAFIDCRTDPPEKEEPCLDDHVLACTESLEELYADTKTYSASAFVSTRFFARLANLRVLGCHRGGVTLATIAPLCPKLTHFLAPFYLTDDLVELQSFTLKELKVVSLSVTLSCDPLRRERGPGRALPMLQSILHPVEDCLWAATCPIAAHVNEHLSVRTWRAIEHDSQRTRSLLFQPAWTWKFYGYDYYHYEQAS